MPEAIPPVVENRLRDYAGLLERFAPTLGLLGPGDVADLWERHILDSLRGLRCIEPTDADIADVGSGGGLPGIPIAIALPDRKVFLIESNRRRAGFLELSLDQLELTNAKVLIERVENIDLRVDVCLARAFAPPLRTWSHASRLLNDRGRVLYYAGQSWKPDVVASLRRAGAMVSECGPPSSAGAGPVISMSRVVRAGRR